MVKKQMGDRRLAAFDDEVDVPTKPDENDYVVYVDDDVQTVKSKLAQLGEVCSSSALPHATTAAGNGLKQCIIGRETVVTVATKNRRGNLVKLHPSLFTATITGHSVPYISIFCI